MEDEKNGNVFYAVRVATKQEKIVAMILGKKAKTMGLNVYSIFFNENVKGYIFIEVDDENTALKLISNTKHVKSLINQPLSFDEIKKMLEQKEEEKEAIEINDIVEIISGPFKGERARVTNIDRVKNVYTVIPLEAAMAIPVNIEGSKIKLVEKKA